jgi:hypothetical protein
LPSVNEEVLEARSPRITVLSGLSAEGPAAILLERGERRLLLDLATDRGCGPRPARRAAARGAALTGPSRPTLPKAAGVAILPARAEGTRMRKLLVERVGEGVLEFLAEAGGGDPGAAIAEGQATAERGEERVFDDAGLLQMIRRATRRTA